MADAWRTMTMTSDPFATRTNKATMKSPTGIPGLDEITSGGLPRGSLSVVTGDAGLGKTILSLQFLHNGSQIDAEPGLFVTFEESGEEILRTAGEFGWSFGLVSAQSDQVPRLGIVAANPTFDMVQAGDFDLNGLLAILSAVTRRGGTKRIVFDGLDAILDLLDEPGARRREILRLQAWVRESGLTAIITSKDARETPDFSHGYDFLRYVASCHIALTRTMSGRVVSRCLEVKKMRHSFHALGGHPIVITGQGISVGDIGSPVLEAEAPTEHVSSGVPRLDLMLGGGYYRTSSILISGAPGTAKTTLCGSFLAAACERGERALMVSFDEPTAQLNRNLRSVGLDLDAYSDAGLLRLVSYRIGRVGPEEHMRRLMLLLEEHRPRIVAIDPISSLTGVVSSDVAGHFAERLVDFLKGQGVTTLLTSLLEGPAVTEENTRAQISSIADTWIHLSFNVRRGERNRALTIIKSRGNAHSNQVRELVLSSDGITLADVYTAGGEVLMGTARLEKEREEELREAGRDAQFRAEELALAQAEAALRARMIEMETELGIIAERRRLASLSEATRLETRGETQMEVLRMRHADLNEHDGAAALDTNPR